MKNYNKTAHTLIIAICAAIIFCVGEAQAATFIVNRTDDAGDGVCDGTCTLRDAVIAANNTATNDTINLLSVFTTFTLTSEIFIGNNGTLTIKGTGANLQAIDGGAGTNRIFFINDGANVTITDVTLTGGNGTGATNSGHGGAVYASNASLTLDRVHITGNSASFDGGGVKLVGQATASSYQILNSTFSNNTATAAGGGFFSIFCNVVIVNSTFTGNSAQNGGGIATNTTFATLVTFRNLTVTGNTATSKGGGLYPAGTHDLSNSIIAGNAASLGNPEISRTGSGTFSSSGYNLVGDSPGDAADTSIAITYQSTDILDTPPLLGALQNNGGPTPTRALLGGSPGIDKGNSFGSTADQRGLLRPDDDPAIANASGGDGADIGAFEMQVGHDQASYTVNSTADTNDGFCNELGTGSGNRDCTLREAIMVTNADPGAETIHFNIPNTDVGCVSDVCTIRPNSPLPDITEQLSIDGLTQPGASCTMWPPSLKVVLNGSNAGPSSNGLTLKETADGSMVRGLVINNFGKNGIGIFSGNTHNGTSNITVQCNFLGTDVTGTAALGNGTGIGTFANFLDDFDSIGDNILIGGTSVSQRNLISGNVNGISGGGGFIVQGNFIGTDVTGTLALGNTENGVMAGSSQVGGSAQGARNIISGNGQNGIKTRLQFSFNGLREVLPTIKGNYIGTDVTGTARLANGGNGILLFNTFAIVGGTEPGEGNVISGNGGSGIKIGTPEFEGGLDVIQGNYIGTDASGTGDLGNGLDGVEITKAALEIVGGDYGQTAGGNIIAFNARDGIRVESDSHNNFFWYNSIFGNGGLGINLGTDGVTPNDTADADTGPNGLQNFPVLTSAVADGSTTTIQGTFNSQPNSEYTLQFFSNAACDPSGNGEGQNYLGETTVTTDANGNATINVNLPVSVLPGQLITATATLLLSTSEFSACVVVLPAEVPCSTITLDPSSPPSGTVGSSYSQTVSASGGSAPYTFAVTSGSLPAGLSLDSSTGEISGEPTTSGSASFTIMATDANGCQGSLAYSLEIACPTISVNPSSVPNGTVGVAYSQTVSASGAGASFTFAVTSGVLPAGLSLNSSTGQISGTPTTEETVNFTITATNQTAGCSGNRSYSITINAAAAQSACPLPQGYWKNNPGAWKVSSLNLGNQSYSKMELLKILNTAAGSGKNADASIILAYQLIAAKLNVANGSDPAPVSGAIADGDSLLSVYSGKLPYRVGSSSAAGQRMVGVASVLERYNKGLLTGACNP